MADMKWSLTCDNVTPYSWCVRKGVIPVRRFIWEDEAHAFFAYATTANPPLQEAHKWTGK